MNRRGDGPGESTKGTTREAGLSRQVYFSDSYFRLRQLFSLAHQLHEIHRLRPEDILEIGIGNGFVSSFLRRAGYSIVTADINPELEPDICAPMNELPSRLGGRNFDLVVCCEVLEHMPFETFEENIQVMAGSGRRLFLTIPDCRRVFGFGGILRLPKWAPGLLNRYVETPWAGPLGKAHFWEIGSTPRSSKRNILRILEKYYTNVRTARFALNPYHVCFTGTSRPASERVEPAERESR